MWNHRLRGERRACVCEVPDAGSEYRACMKCRVKNLGLVIEPLSELGSALAGSGPRTNVDLLH